MARVLAEAYEQWLMGNQEIEITKVHPALIFTLLIAGAVTPETGVELNGNMFFANFFPGHPVVQVAPIGCPIWPQKKWGRMADYHRSLN